MYEPAIVKLGNVENNTHAVAHCEVAAVVDRKTPCPEQMHR